MNEVQQAQADLIRLSSYPEVDGETIIKDLLANKDLWLSFYMNRVMVKGFDQKFAYTDYIVKNLFDIYNSWACYDTLYILTSGKHIWKLEKIALKSWKAHKVFRNSTLIETGIDPVTKAKQYNRFIKVIFKINS